MLSIVREDYDSIVKYEVKGTVGASFAADLRDGTVEKLA